MVKVKHFNMSTDMSTTTTTTTIPPPTSTTTSATSSTTIEPGKFLFYIKFGFPCQ